MKKLLTASLLFFAATASAQFTYPVQPAGTPVFSGGTITTAIQGPIGCSPVSFGFTGSAGFGVCMLDADDLLVTTASGSFVSDAHLNLGTTYANLYFWDAGSQKSGLQVLDGSVSFFTNSGQRLQIVDGSVVPTVPIQGPNGSNSLPAFSFSADPDTGMYSGGANIIAFATSGSAQLTVTTQVLGPTGFSPSAPDFAFAADPDTGMFRDSGDVLAFSTGGTARMAISNTAVSPVVPVLTGNGTASAPAYSFATDPNTGIFQNGADVVGISAGGTAVASVSLASGLVLNRTITAGGTTGAQTINKVSGTVNFAAAATTLVVTNSLVNTSSIIYCTIRTNDTTALIKNVIPASGSFTIRLNAAATAETSVGFLVTN